MASAEHSPARASWVKPDNNFDHVNELARQLVRHLGVDGARRCCEDNRWSSVLGEVDRVD